MNDSLDDLLNLMTSVVLTAAIVFPALGIYLWRGNRAEDLEFERIVAKHAGGQEPARSGGKRRSGAGVLMTLFLLGAGLLLTFMSAWILPFVAGFVSLGVAGINSALGAPLTPTEEAVAGLGISLIVVAGIVYFVLGVQVEKDDRRYAELLREAREADPDS